MMSSEKSFAAANHALFLYFPPYSAINDSFTPNPRNIGKLSPAFSTKFFIAESDSRIETSGATNFFRLRMSWSAFLEPVYSIGIPWIKSMRVGNPSTPYFDPSFLYLSAFTLATTMGELNPANTGAASSNSGARRLQCPHHGA
uniref:Pdi10 n=1 Tax=Arundo donax TaxID=35708 RepID=A0A0A9HB44_ARUDO